MRRLLSLFLALALLLGLAAPALAAPDYAGIAMAYIKAKHGVTEAKIQMYEGGLMELEFTRESFWVARYIAALKGELPPMATDLSRGAEPSGGIEPAIMPAPGPSTRPLPLPQPDPAVPPKPPIDDPYKDCVFGEVFIRVKTGEVLDSRAMEGYWAAEQALAEREWERLRQEAGKLDVSLYRKLLTLPAGEKLTVWVHPAPVVTDELLAQFAALQAKYPKVAPGAKLADLLANDYAQILPAVMMDGGQGGAAPPTTGKTTPAQSPEGTTFAPDQNRSATDAGLITRMDDEYWRDQAAFWQEFEAIRLHALTPSMAALREAMAGMDMAYTDKETSLTADLTAAQIRAVGDLRCVSTVHEDQVFHALGGEGSVLRGSTTDLKSLGDSGHAAPTVPLVRDGASDTLGSYALPLGAGVIIVVALGGFAARRRRSVR